GPEGDLLTVGRESCLIVVGLRIGGQVDGMASGHPLEKQVYVATEGLGVDEERAVRRQAGEHLAPREIGQLGDLPRLKGGSRIVSPPGQEAYSDTCGQRDGPQGSPDEPALRPTGD